MEYTTKDDMILNKEIKKIIIVLPNRHGYKSINKIFAFLIIFIFRFYQFAIYFLDYRTLHSYKLFWAVCHLFPQRWRTLNIQSRETIDQEGNVTCLKLRRRVNSSPAFLSHLQDAYFL